MAGSSSNRTFMRIVPAAGLPPSDMDKSGARDYAKIRTKACIFTFWGVLAVIGVYCATIYILDVLPKHWFPSRFTMWHVNRGKEFKLQFKPLYVFSKLLRTVGSNFTDLSFNTSRNAMNNISDCGEFSSFQISDEHGEVRQELCASSGIVKERTFTCSKLLPSSENIFFLESSCAASNSHPWMLHQASETPNVTLTLSEKQACSIYSAAYHNPSRKVILLFTCPVPAGYNWTKEWNILFDLPNFFFGHVNLADLYANTSLSDFYHGPLAHSKFPVSHQSDIFRQFVLYLYGGTYMDLDVISIRSLDDLGVNFVIHEGAGSITAGVWNFEPNHHFLEQCLFRATHHYEPQVWNTIGPALFTNTLKRFCDVSGYLDSKLLMNLSSCNIRVLPQYTFFSVHHKKWEYLFKCNLWPEVQNMTRDSYGVHYWNHKANLTLYVGSSQAIIKFAEQHCPPVYYDAGRILS